MIEALRRVGPALRQASRTTALLLASFTSLAAMAAGSLTVCTEASPDGFDIAQSESSVTIDAVGNTLYDQLLMYKRGSTDLVPGLAQAWQVSADGLSITLQLRPGVKFHRTPWFTPTRDMNADDVLFSFQRMANPKSPWQAVAKGGYLMWHGTGMADALQSIEKLDAMTVRLHLKRPNAPMLNLLANAFNSSVFSAEYGAQLLKAGKLEQINTLPVGTGPFQLRNYQKDAVLRLAAHPSYWGGKSDLDQLIFAITPDANVRVQRLKAGECLLGANMRGESLAGFEGTPIKVQAQATLLTAFIALNTQHRFLSDKRFRRALAISLDRASYVQSVYGGRAVPAGSFLPPPQWSHDPTLRFSNDLEQARAWVKASGYDGSELQLFTRMGGSIDAKRAAELMQSDWAKIGVKVRVQLMEWGEMLRRAGQGEHDITFFNWVGDGDPDTTLAPNLSCEGVSSGNNKSRWCDKAFDALLAEARRQPDRAARAKLYQQAQAQIFDEVPVIPTVYPQYFTAVHQRVRGFVSSPFADLDFRGVTLH